MIVDFHAHTFPDRIAAAAVDKLKHASHTRPFSDGTAAGLKSSTVMYYWYKKKWMGKSVVDNKKDLFLSHKHRGALSSGYHSGK